MNCPICRQSVPFGLQMHMVAAHGPMSAEYQRRAAELAKPAPQKPGQRVRGKKRRGKPAGQKQLKYPHNSKLS